MSGGLHVVHVDPALLALDVAECHDQLACQPRHALLVHPGVVLCLCRAVAQHQVLRDTHMLDADDLLAKFSRLAGQREQRGLHPGSESGGQRLLQFDTLGGKGFGAGTTQRTRGRPQHFALRRRVQQPACRRRGALAFREMQREVRHVVFNTIALVG